MVMPLVVWYYFIVPSKFSSHTVFVLDFGRQYKKLVLQNESYYKIRERSVIKYLLQSVTNCDRKLLQSASDITKCYRSLLQSAPSFTKSESYCEVRPNIIALFLLFCIVSAYQTLRDCPKASRK